MKTYKELVVEALKSSYNGVEEEIYLVLIEGVRRLEGKEAAREVSILTDAVDGAFYIKTDGE